MAVAQPDLTRVVGETVIDRGSEHYRFETLRLSSADGERRYRVYVAVPETPPPAAGWPMLWLLDGNAALMHVDEPLLAKLADAAHPPALAFVAYDNDLRIDAQGRAYDYTPRRCPGLAPERDPLGDRPSGGADPFIDLLTGEMRERVAARWPLDPGRQAIWGHSYGGLLVLHALTTRPAAFSRYVAVDPSLWWGQGQMLDAAERLGDAQGAHLLLFVGTGEHLSRAGRDDPRALIRSQVPADAPAQLAIRLADAGVTVDLRELPGLTHGETLGASLGPALHAFATGR